MNRFNLKLFSVLIHSIPILLLFSCGSFVHHQVKSGETLYSIGWKYNVDYKTLAEWNDIDAPYLIHQGQWLRVVPPLEDEPQAVTPGQPNDIARIKRRLGKKPKTDGSKQTQAKSTTETVRETKPEPQQSPSQIRAESGIDWLWPAKGSVLKTFSNNSQGKKGIDIGGIRGQDILASASGQVVYSGSGIIGLGNLVIIKHNKTFLSAYAHNERLLVKEGQQVEQGQVIAKMGDTGTERVLLHFEIRKNGKPVNPLHYLAEKK